MSAWIDDTSPDVDFIDEFRTHNCIIPHKSPKNPTLLVPAQSLSLFHKAQIGEETRDFEGVLPQGGGDILHDRVLVQRFYTGGWDACFNASGGSETVVRGPSMAL